MESNSENDFAQRKTMAVDTMTKLLIICLLVNYSPLYKFPMIDTAGQVIKMPPATPTRTIRLGALIWLCPISCTRNSLTIDVIHY
jgi:hypothetical protein